MMNVEETISNMHRCSMADWNADLASEGETSEGCSEKDKCPYAKIPYCRSRLFDDSIQFVRHQKEQIETLENQVECLKADNEKKHITKKNKRIKEFMEALENLVDAL